VRAAQRRFVQAATAAYRHRLTYELSTAALQILDELAHVQAELAADLDRLSARLDSAAQLLLAAAGDASTEMAVDLELADPGHIAQLYDRHAPSLGDTAALCLDGQRELLEWVDRPAIELARWLQQRAAQLFEPVLQLNVEAALQEHGDQASPEARRLWLLERATPSWNLDRSRLRDGGAGLASVTVLGVPDAHETLFAEQGGTLVSTGDDRRITALRVTVGAPHTALQRFPAWERAYQRKRGSRPLHVLPAFHASKETALQAFALGLIFRLIFAQGSYYYYRPVDKLDEPERLAQGLQKAVGAFAAREGLAREVLERVDQHISTRLTMTQAIEKLDAYCTAGEGGQSTDELDRQLRKAAREYADRLREMLAASEGIVGVVQQ
jgi:hypothetical protein